MSNLEFTLPVIWALIIGTSVGLYVLLDGFDLGVGILFPLYPEEARRDQMMNTVAPFWDGNETWLVLGGGGLWVAFPKAYAVIMPALYLPVIVMLLALVLRGVAFEFRWVAKPSHRIWDLAFAGGSLVAAFSQGVMLGGLLQGIKVVDGQFAGGTLDWLSPFSLLCGVGLVSGYALLGATWLIYKTDGPVEKRARLLATPLLFTLLAVITLVSAYTPFAIGRIREFWFSVPNIYFLAPIPILSGVLALYCWRGIRGKAEVQALLCAEGVFLLAFVGLVLSNAPYLVPPTITVWDAAAAAPSQLFMLTGTCLLLPMILGYTVFSYWTFRGKVKEHDGYH